MRRNISLWMIGALCLALTSAGAAAGCGEKQNDQPRARPEPAMATLSQSLRGGEEPGDVWIPEGADMERPPPPYIAPVRECSGSVLVQGLPNARINVYDTPNHNNSGAIGSGTADRDGFVNVAVSSSMMNTPGAKLYATQSVNGRGTSDNSPARVILAGPPERWLKPRMVQKVWQCSGLAGVKGVEPGLQLHLEKDASNPTGIGSAADPTSRYNGYWWVYHNDLGVGQLPTQVRAYQTFCPGTSKEDKGPVSDWRDVLNDPEPIPEIATTWPSVDLAQVSTSTVLRGAEVRVTEHPQQGSDTQYAYSSAIRWTAPIFYGGEVNGTSEYSAQQKLCGDWSDPIPFEPLPEGEIEERLRPPKIVDPICPGARVIQIFTSLDGGVVEVDWPGSNPHTYVAGSTAGVYVTVPLGMDLKPGQDVFAIHYFPGPNNTTYSSDPQTPGVGTVDDADNHIEVVDEPSYVNSRTGERFNSLVREVNRGPKFALHCCENCDGVFDEEDKQCYVDDTASGALQPRTASVDIEHNGNVVATIELTEEYPGYFTGRWEWWVEPGDMPIWPPPAGQYKAKLQGQSPCGGSVEDRFFTVESDPLHFLTDFDTRAMWVWAEKHYDGGGINWAEDIIYNNAGRQDALFNFLEAPHGKSAREIERIFFEARQYVYQDAKDSTSYLREVHYDPLTDQDEWPALRDFLRRAHEHNVTVEYLDGHHIWPATQSFADKPVEICQLVTEFNAATSDPAERFDGIHFDVEPHTTKASKGGTYAGEWLDNRPAPPERGYNQDWMDNWEMFLTECRGVLDDYAQATGHQMTFSSDFGTDYYFYNDRLRNFINRSDGPLDYVTIMNYYDNYSRPDNSNPSYFYGDIDFDGYDVGGVIKNLNAWTNIPVMFAVETKHDADSPDETFWQEGYNEMHLVIDQLFGGYGARNMIGVAIHHYEADPDQGDPDAYADMSP